MMTTKEMIEVLQAYEEGKEIEIFIDAAKSWKVVEYPAWNFASCVYRVKKNPTRLEVANEFWEKAFGIRDRFTNRTCIAKNCKNCPIEKQTFCVAENLETWWNEEW